MVQTDAVEGIVNDALRFHYDIFADVLYLRRLDAESTPTYGDITDAGDILLRDEQSDRPVGITIIKWWKRFGQGELPDSLREISARVQPFATQLAA